MARHVSREESVAVRLSAVETFGGIDADQDSLLRACFQNHRAYRDARGHRRFLIIGRKRSGKTAIFRQLVTERSPAYFCFGHTFMSYPWAHHDLQAQTGVPEELRYAHSWRYLILMSLSKIILNHDQSLPWSEAAMEAHGKIENFVVDSYGSKDPDLTQLFSPSTEIKLKGTFRAPFVEIAGEKLRVTDLPAHVDEVNRQVSEYVLNALNPENDYYVCFDELDREYDPTDDRYAQRVIGLILAARDVNRAAKEAGKRLSIVVFLRNDIYHELHFEDKNKLTEGNLSTIEWGTGDSDLSLKKLMERRFSQVLRPGGHVPWEEVFDESKEMSSRQTKYRHICDRTFLRPRDIIKFCNEVLAQHKSMDHDDHGNQLFDNSSIISARNRYSEYLLRELDDEISKRLPNYSEYLDVLRSIGSIEFTVEQFDAIWHRRQGHQGAPSLEGLRALFDASVIGYLKLGGMGGGSTYVWKYKDPLARLAPDSEIFRVHPGFKEALELAKGRRQVS